MISSAELYNQNLAGWFKYCREESKSFKEQQWLYTESKQRYETLKKATFDKKMKLYKQKPKNVMSWGVSPENYQNAVVNAGNPEALFPLMLTAETKRVNYME